MTIVIALSCSDGVVMASDSQASEMAAGVRFNVPKIFQLANRAVWGGTGDSQTISEIDRALQVVRPQIEGPADLTQILPMVIRPVLQRRYANFIQVPGMQPATPATGTLACGYDAARGGGWIVEVDYNCVSSNYGDRGFHAVGSAAGFALLGNALLAHFRPSQRPLSQGKLIAYRVIDAAVKTAMMGVGGPIQMWYVDADGVHHADDDEMAETQASVGGWQDEEGKLLDRIFGDEPAAPEPSPAPPETEAASAAAS
jgi:20S proteasome alpha/beta subunit